MASTIRLKRSAVPGKAPSVSDLALGEVGINTFDGKVFIKKDNGAESIVELGADGGIQYYFSSTPPSSPSAGDEWTDSDTGITYKYINDGDSSQWVEFGPNTGGGGSGPLALTAQVISADLTLATGFNGLSVGPVEVAATYAVTVPANATWVII